MHCFGKIGPSAGELQQPEGICLSPDEVELFVADTFNHRVQVFSPDGQFLRMWGSYGSGPGHLRYPSDIKISGSREETFVSDCRNHRVSVFRPDGTFLRALGDGEGSGDGQLFRPRGLALTARGTILVCEEGNHRVSELRVTDGAFVCKWGKNEGAGGATGKRKQRRRV